MTLHPWRGRVIGPPATAVRTSGPRGPLRARSARSPARERHGSILVGRARALPPLPLRGPSEGRRKQDHVRATPPARAASTTDGPFATETISGLLIALQLRAEAHPDSPGLIANWPGVSEAQMPAACAVLRRQGHAVRAVSIAGRGAKVRRGWSVGG